MWTITRVSGFKRSVGFEGEGRLKGVLAEGGGVDDEGVVLVKHGRVLMELNQCHGFVASVFLSSQLES